MNIALVSPLFESVPPKGYGGTERVVSYLTEALVVLGHCVTLFASGDSHTSAQLVAGSPVSIRTAQDPVNPLVAHLCLMEQVFARATDFDLIHFHTDFFQYPAATRQTVPYLTTLHGRLDLPELVMLFNQYSEVAVNSISRAQRSPLPWLNWVGNVYHGLPIQLYQPTYTPGKYLAFIGRISPEKGFDRAVEIARQAGLPLKVAAKIDKADVEYYTNKIEPLLARSPHVEFIGEIGDSDKSEFLGKALALLFPIDWPEPFGLVMIEAMACGTPVIAFDRGSVSEVIRPGINGFIVDGVTEAVNVISTLKDFDRHRCRQTFESHFSAERMAKDYLQLYGNLIKKGRDGKSSRRYYSGQRTVLCTSDLVAS